MCEKPTANLVRISGRSVKYLASLYTYAQSRQSHHSSCESIYYKYFKRVCETILALGAPVQKVRDLQRLLRCLFSFEMSTINKEPFCEISVLKSCVSSIGSNQPTHLCSLDRAFTSSTQCTYRICTHMHPFLTCRRNYPEIASVLNFGL